MPLKEDIQAAKKEGYSEEQIWEHVITSRDDIQQAFKEGHSETDVKNYLGLMLTDRESAELTRQKALKKLEPLIKDIKTWPSQALKPFKTAVRVWGEEAKAGYKTMAEELQDLSLKSAYKLPLGAAQYAFAPVTGAARAVGEAVREPAEMLMPKEYAEFAGRLGEEATYFIPPTAIGRGVGLLKKVPKMVKPSGKVIKELEEAIPLPKKKVVEPKRLLNEEIPKIFKGDERLLSKGVSESLIDDATKGAEQALQGKVEEGRRIFHQIADKLKISEIQIEDLPDILKKYNLTPEQFAQEYEHTISRAGRVLAYHSRAAKRLQAVFANEPKALKILEDALASEKGERYVSDILFELWAKFDQPRRAILVSQLATAMRNAWSQAGRISLGTADTMLQEVIGGGSTRDAIKVGLTTFSGIWGRLSPSGRKRLAQVLESEGAGLAKARLISQPVHEVAIGSKFAHMVNILNRGQEYFFRKLAFEAKLKQLMQKKGLDFTTIDPKKIPEGMIEEATNYGLEMTFAASAKGKFAQDFIRVWSKSPLTTINPFPRFAFANALPFVVEHSPLGYLRAFSPKTLEALASGHPERFAKAASRATIGTLMLESAWHIRQSKYAGDRWNEIKIGEPDPKTGEQRVIDLRAYAPLSTPFFIAECFVHPERLKGKDFAEAAIGLNRIAGSGLVLVDLLRTKKVESVKDLLSRVVGAYAGSYTVTARTAKDILAGTVDPEEAMYREKRLNPISAPFLENLPKISQLLPEAVSPITSKRIRAESPLLKQLTGFTTRIKTPVHQEIDKLGLDWSSIYPKTGVREADYEMAKYMGPLVEAFAPSLILSNPNYANANIFKKRMILKGFFKLIRREAKGRLQIINPKLAVKISIEGISDDEKRMLEKETGLNLNKLFE